MKKSRSAFTIVELLIVIVIIGILAAITVVAYNGIQNRTRVARAQSDLSQFIKAVNAARINTDKTLMQVTGNNCTNCTSTPPMITSIDKISVASGIDISGLKNGDPWGNQYILDENEGEQAGNPCVRDGLSVNGHPEVTSSGKYSIPFSLLQCL